MRLFRAILLVGLVVLLLSVAQDSYAQQRDSSDQPATLFLPLINKLGQPSSTTDQLPSAEEAFVEGETASTDLVLSAATLPALLPIRYVTTSGSDGGQPVTNLHVQDQSGTQDTWAKYVELVATGGTKYVGYRVYALPSGTDPATITALQLKANYKGPLKSLQTWTWTIYNWSTKQWVSLGDNTGAPDWQWKLFTFNVGGTLRDYVNLSTREMHVRLQANNTKDNMDLDYEALLVSTGNASPTATPTLTPTPTRTTAPTPTRTPYPTPTPTTVPAAATKTVTYGSTTELFANPERGFYRYFASRSSQPTTWAVTDFTNTNAVSWLSAAEEATITQAYCLFYLDTFLRSDISVTFLSHIRANLTNVRTAGRKCILRFAYSDNSTDSNGNDVPDILENAKLDTEPDLPQLLRHIDQLAPILQENADVIAVLHAGFIGLWGEWYYTDHFVDTPNQPDVISPAQYTRRKEVVTRLLSALPANRTIALRYPVLKKNMFGRTTPITPSEAFQNTPLARLGFHNDAFLNSYGDSGTFQSEADRTYLQAESLYLTMGGEVNQPESGAPSRSCANAISAMATYHWSYINTDYYIPTLQSWQSGKCIHNTSNMAGSMLDRLGYRLVIKKGIYPTTARPGGTIALRIELMNEGFAAPVNPRDLYVILHNATTGAIFTAKLPDDPRLWLANGQTHVIARTITLPATLATGQYALYLHLPDPAATLSSKPAYAIRLANANLWKPASGWNDLLHTVTVSNSARDAGADNLGENLIFSEAGTLLPADNPTALELVEETSPEGIEAESEQLNHLFLPLVTQEAVRQQ